MGKVSGIKDIRERKSTSYKKERAAEQRPARMRMGKKGSALGEK